MSLAREGGGCAGGLKSRTQTSQVSKRMEMPGCNLFWVKSSCIVW